MANKRDQKLVRSLIKKYITILKKQKIDVREVYIFGSYAKGTYNEWSDIDLAVVTKNFIGDSFDFKFLLMKIAKNIDIDFEPHPILTKDFKKNNPFANEIIKTGIKIK